MLISAPTNFDFVIPKALKNEIYETYGNLNLPHEDTLPSYVPQAVSFKKLQAYVAFSHDMGIQFNYIMNHPQLNLNKRLISLLDDLKKIKVDNITLANKSLITFIKKEYPFRIYSSITCRIDTLEEAAEYKRCGCDVICLFYSKNKDLEFIRNVKTKLSVMVKILVNNICLPDCPYEKEHWNEPENFDRTTVKCLRLKLEDPSLIEKSGFIHPHFLKKYEEIGVDFIKLGGRGKPAWWIINCAKSYYKQIYQGNAFRLMNTTGSENRYPPAIKLFLATMPTSAIRQLLKLMYLVTKKEIFKIAVKEKNVKSLLYLRLTNDYFSVNENGQYVCLKKKYLLKVVDEILRSE